MESRAATLFDISHDTLTNELLAQLISVGSVITFARSSPHLYSLYSKTYQYRLLMDYLKKAFDHVCFGEFDDLDFLLQACPEILTIRCTIQHRGRFKLTDRFLWQIAEMNEEGDNERVRTMFVKYFKRLPDGLNEMARQSAEVFSKGMIKHGWDINEAIRLFDNLYQAILNDDTLDEADLTKMNDATRTALQAFYSYVLPKPSEEFREGLIFDVRLFSEVVKRYDDKFYELKDWNRRVFYGVKIWDELVKVLPTGYLRPICQGLYYVVGAPAANRAREQLTVNGCRLRSGVRVLPLGSDPNFVFGRDFINVLGGADLAESGFLRTRGGAGIAHRFGILMSSKNIKQKEIYAAVATTSPSPSR